MPLLSGLSSDFLEGFCRVFSSKETAGADVGAAPFRLRRVLLSIVERWTVRGIENSISTCNTDEVGISIQREDSLPKTGAKRMGLIGW